MNRYLSILISGAALACGIQSRASAGIIVDHPPTGINGQAADTAWIDYWGQNWWQQTADDFQLSSPAVLSRITWRGFYGDVEEPVPPPHPPVGSESMRIR